MSDTENPAAVIKIEKEEFFDENEFKILENIGFKERLMIEEIKRLFGGKLINGI